MPARFANEQNAELKIAEGGAWSTAELRQKGITRQELERGRRRFRIAYWRDRFGSYHYPKWQFDPSMRVIPEVADILATFRTHDTARILTWFVRPVAPGSKSLLDLIRKGKGQRAIEVVREEERADASFPPLSRKELAELRRRVKETDDPTRYAIASSCTKQHVLFYDVQHNHYILNQIEPTCLFRQREHALAIATLLDGPRDRGRTRHQVVEVKSTSSGVRLSGSLRDSLGGNKRVKPRLRARAKEKAPILVPLMPPKTRGHIVESFVFVIENQGAVSALVAGARSRREAEQRLMKETSMSPEQAAAVLELRLWHFTRRERDKWLVELRSLLRGG